MKVLASLSILLALLAVSQATAETRSITIGKFMSVCARVLTNATLIGSQAPLRRASMKSTSTISLILGLRLSRGDI